MVNSLCSYNQCQNSVVETAFHVPCFNAGSPNEHTYSFYFSNNVKRRRERQPPFIHHPTHSVTNIALTEIVDLKYHRIHICKS